MNFFSVVKDADFGSVDVIYEDGKTYFPASECAAILGYKNPQDAIARHCRWVVKRDLPHPQNADKTIVKNFISEGDLYRLIVNSKLPSAEKFERWVFDDVLPTIRKQGYYSTIKDEDLLAIIGKRRKEDATYLLEGLAEERDKLNAERYEQLKVIWNTRRFDLNLEQVDELIDEIWHGDIVGADEAKEHYHELYHSRLGMSRVYGQWKDPKKPKQRKFTREKEIIQYYEKVALQQKLDEILNNGECRIEDCENSIDLLERRDRAVLKQYYEIQNLKAENERLKNMVNAAVN